MSEKKVLRKAVLLKRKKIPAALRRSKSSKIFRKLFEDPAFQRTTHVALYYGMAPEVATRPFLKKISKGRKIYLPRAHAKKNMTFHQVRVLSRDLEKRPHGILQPKLSCPVRTASRMDMILVPGVAFDRKGGRLGRGAGYYDRFLRRAKKVPKIGLCFREQLVKKVPMNPHDVRVDRIITD